MLLKKRRINDLHVFIACRDRPILTEKTIDSIYDRSVLFDNINIYCYDNLSIPDENRLTIFSKLLMEKKIVYYSYDTNISTGECFPKAVAINRWMSDMIRNQEMKKTLVDPEGIIHNYYLLIDNDMILGPDWDKIFISALDDDISKNLYFITQFPGGITGRGRLPDPNKTSIVNIKNKYGSSNFDFILASRGGSSGFWFMNIGMLKKLLWPIEIYREVFRRYKKQDSATWKMIFDRHGRDFKYVGAVVPNENPYVVHLGDYVGSICKSEMMKDYDKEKNKFIYREEERFKDKTHEEIFEEFKERGSKW